MSNLFQIILSDIAEIEKKSFARFNYRERMKIERTLFLILNTSLNFPITGFSDLDKTMILKQLKESNASIYKINFINKIFEFRHLLKALSSGNPYEKYDALFNNQSDRINIFKHLGLRIEKIQDLMKYCD